jgi:hypothetical protein
MDIRTFIIDVEPHLTEPPTLAPTASSEKTDLPTASTDENITIAANTSLPNDENSTIANTTTSPTVAVTVAVTAAPDSAHQVAAPHSTPQPAPHSHHSNVAPHSRSHHPNVAPHSHPPNVPAPHIQNQASALSDKSVSFAPVYVLLAVAVVGAIIFVILRRRRYRQFEEVVVYAERQYDLELSSYQPGLT